MSKWIILFEYNYFSVCICFCVVPLMQICEAVLYIFTSRFVMVVLCFARSSSIKFMCSPLCSSLYSF